MKRDIRICKLRNWWLTQRYDNRNKRFWILHGNIMPEETLIESSAIQCIFTFNKQQLMMESADTRYCCDIRYTLEEKFDWLYDSKIWLQRFHEEEIQDYITSIQSIQRKRGLKDMRDTALELDTDEYLLLALSDKNEELYLNGLYCKSGIHQYPQVKIEKNADGITVVIDIHSGIAEENRVEVVYKIKEDNVIELFETREIYLSNCGRNNLYAETIFGRFCIPNNNRLYKISGNVIRGRVPVY